MRSAASVDAATGIGLREPWTNPERDLDARQSRLECRHLRQDRPHHLRPTLGRKRELGHRRCRRRIGEVRGPDEPQSLERQLFVSGALRGQLVEFTCPLAHGFGRTPKHLLIELRPPPVAYRAQRVDCEHAEDPLGQPLGDHAGRGGRPTSWPTTYAFSQPSASRTRRASSTSAATEYGPSAPMGQPSLLVPDDVVLDCELFGEGAEVLEAGLARRAAAESGARCLPAAA